MITFAKGNETSLLNDTAVRYACAVANRRVADSTLDVVPRICRFEVGCAGTIRAPDSFRILFSGITVIMKTEWLSQADVEKVSNVQTMLLSQR